MQNLTRRLYLINSTEPRWRLLSHATPSHLTARFSAGASLLIKHKSLQFATFKNPNRSPVTSRLRELHYFLKVMDSDVANRPESNAASPNSNDEGSDQSVVLVNENRGVEDAGSPNGVVDGEERKVLPEKLWRSVMKLTCETSAEGGNCDVYLVGTAHVSMESCHEVQAVINFLKPQVVFLELCASRIAILTPQDLKVPTVGEMIEQWKKKNNAFGILYSWFLAKVASKLEVFPGSEFRVAYEEAMKYGGKVILGDRPVNITLRRTWGKMPLWHKTKLLYSLVFQAFFLPSPEHLNQMLKDMDDVDVLTLVIQEMSKEFPTVMETLVHERDKYMSSMLLNIASEHSSIVAVVGKGHLQGIKKHWKQPVELDKLLDMPSKKPMVSALKILKTLGITFTGVAIISCIYHSCRK